MGGKLHEISICEVSNWFRPTLGDSSNSQIEFEAPTAFLGELFVVDNPAV
jgi:hypothetical protein